MEKLISFIKDRKNQKHYLKWLIHTTKAYQWQLIGLLLLNALISAAGVFGAQINKNIIDYASSEMTFRIFIIILVIVEVFCLLGAMFVSFAQTVITEKYAFYVRKSLFRSVMYAVWKSREEYHSEELLSRMTSDVDKITSGASDFFISIGSLMVQLVLAFFLLLTYSHLLAWLALGLGPVAGLTGLILGRKIHHIQKEIQQTEADYRIYMQERISKMDLIKIFGQEDNTIGKLETIQQRRIQLVTEKSKWKAFGVAIVTSIFTGTYLLAFVIGALKVGNGSITFGTLTAFLILVGQIQSPLYSLANKLPQIVGILASAGRVMEITEWKAEDFDSIDLLPSIPSIGIEAEDITIAYDDENIIAHQSFSVKPGEMVMIEGCSGRGKTTLLRALMGFLPCKEGCIFFIREDGSRVMCSAASRKMISYVPQGNTLFFGTIAENLRVAKPDATDTELKEALQKACAWDFISGLPDGLFTEIGERASGLSEGQAQRIAIARALLKECGLLILDEATSALDEETESKILANIFETDHPTCLFVSHRKYLDRFADRKIQL